MKSPMDTCPPEKLKMLIVDDEPDNLDLLYRTFRLDFQVLRSESAISALALLEKHGEVAIIISDQRMPEMLGTEFLSLAAERFPDTIRIVLTAYTDVKDLVDAINSGKVFKYITKPWNQQQLQAVIQQAAETYQVLKQRTDELRRSLRRESLFNVVITAIRPGGDKSFGDLRPTALGLAAAATFALSAVGYRGAILQVPGVSFVTAASFTLVLGLMLQTLVLTTYLLARDRDTMRALLRMWKPSLLAGFLGAAASQFWFLGFAITSVANVRTLALIEVLFAQAIAYYTLKQKLSMREALGIALIVVGVGVLIAVQ